MFVCAAISKPHVYVTGRVENQAMLGHGVECPRCFGQCILNEGEGKVLLILLYKMKFLCDLRMEVKNDIPYECVGQNDKSFIETYVPNGDGIWSYIILWTCDSCTF